MPAATHVGDSWSWAMTPTRAACAAAATAASADAGTSTFASYAYGRERRSIAFSASWIATWVMAYRRASAGPLPKGDVHAAMAALPAFSFQMRTASVLPELGRGTSRQLNRQTTTVCFMGTSRSGHQMIQNAGRPLPAYVFDVNRYLPVYLVLSDTSFLAERSARGSCGSSRLRVNIPCGAHRSFQGGT